jgi:hypothetical protein
MSTRFAAVAAAVAALAGASPAGATPPPTTNFQHHFPAASKLCENVAKGKGPVALRPSAASVLADCATLESAFSTAQAAELAALPPIETALAAARSTTAAACPTPRTHAALCVKTRRTEHPVIATLEAQRFGVIRTFRTTLGTARLAFWHAIESLPGGAKIKA